MLQRFSIDFGGVNFGMIRLGFNCASIYPNSGIIWESRGRVIFNGNTTIGNASAISVGKTGLLNFGSRFCATTALKLVCYNKIIFEDNVLIGWDCTISDTDFHTLHYDGKKAKGYGKILIGHDTWVAMQSLILKGTNLPPYSVVAARSLVNKDFSDEKEKILLSGHPAQVTRRNIYRDRNDDTITYGDSETVSVG